MCQLQDYTWREGATNAAGHGVAQGALHPAGHDREQQTGEPVQALAACETVACRTGNRGANEGALLWLPEAQDQPEPAVCAYLWEYFSVTCEVYRWVLRQY